MVIEIGQRLFTVDEYHRVVEAGVFGPKGDAYQSRTILARGERITPVSLARPRNRGIESHTLEVILHSVGKRRFSTMRPDDPYAREMAHMVEHRACRHLRR